MKSLASALFLMAASAAAAPVITSVSPSSGPAGTAVTIRGSGLAMPCITSPCLQLVTFRGTPATFTVLDDSTIIAIAPPNLSGPADVTRSQGGIFFTLANAFTYTETSPDFERLLLPIFAPATAGIDGTIFDSFFSIWLTSGPDIKVFGFRFTCLPLPGTPCAGPETPLEFQARYGAARSQFQPWGDPGLFLWITRDADRRIATTLRVRERTREQQTWGTMIPVVPERDFRAEGVILLDVPLQPQFRTRLRVYSLDTGVTVRVRVVRSDSTRIYQDFDLTLNDAADKFHPSYAEFFQFNASDNVRIEVDPRDGKRIWAFASVTHNETEHITIVTPR